MMFNSMEYNSIFKNNGIEIHINDDDFLKVKETLTRIGIAQSRTKTLYQTCHILHKRGRYGILHFKELFYLDDKSSTIDDKDYMRRNYIVKLLCDWDLIEIDERNYATNIDREVVSHLKILPFSQKAQWNLVTKYTIGNNKHG